VEVPLQRVVDPDALTDEPFAVIDQQPDVELRAGQRRRRQRLNAFSQRRSAVAVWPRRPLVGRPSRLR
jgi:hypothetical protein